MNVFFLQFPGFCLLVQKLICFIAVESLGAHNGYYGESYFLEFDAVS
jgi:hypothetical protein